MVAKSWKNYNSICPDDKLVLAEWEGHTYNHSDGTTSVKEDGSATIPSQWIQIWMVDAEKSVNGYDSNVIHHGEIDNVQELLVERRVNGKVYQSYPIDDLEIIPAFLFEGKKEGDTVEVIYKGVTFRLTLNQTSYRYARFGKFEDAFRHVTK